MIDAAIFDLDGTILDSNMLWDEVDRVFLANHGLTRDASYHRAVTEMEYRQSAMFVVEHFQLPDSPEAIMAEWENLSYQGYRDWLPLKDGVQEVLAFLREQQVPMALVTLSPVKFYEAALNRLEIFDYFTIHQSVSKHSHRAKIPALYRDICQSLGAVHDPWGFDDQLNALQAMEGANVRAYAIEDVRNKALRKDYQVAGFQLRSWSEIIEELHKEF